MRSEPSAALYHQNVHIVFQVFQEILCDTILNILGFDAKN